MLPGSGGGCREHGGRRYTLYPPGHYPYGRVAAVPYSAGGELWLDADSMQPQWQATLFGAAQEAQQEKKWAAEQNWWRQSSTPSRRTQGRWLELAGRLTGVSPELEEREREQIATRLGVATMTVLAGAGSWERSWQSRGAAIVAVLVALAVTATLGDRMGAAGAVSDLEPQPRTRIATSQALSSELVTFVRTERQRDARASVPELVRRARERGIIPVDLEIDRTTVWRACRRMGLPTRQRPHKRDGDTRRWRYAERMQCVLADGKHFRAGAARLRRVALFFLDDATRYGLAVVVGTAESSALFLRGLHEVVMHHGSADLYYLDKGPGLSPRTPWPWCRAACVPC